MAPDPKLNEQQAGPTLAPIVFAIGVAVILAGLVVNLEVIAPAGVAITVLAAVAWIRGSGKRSPAQTKSLEPATNEGERFPRSRLLERATLGLGGLVAAGVALPAIGAAVLPAFSQAAARTSAVRRSRTDRSSSRRRSSGGRTSARSRSYRLCPREASAAPVTAASSTPRAIARPGRPRGRSIGISSLFATGASSSARSTASAGSTAQPGPRGSTASNASATASLRRGPSRSSTRSTRSHERLRARHQLGGDGVGAALRAVGARRLRPGPRRLCHGA